MGKCLRMFGAVALLALLLPLGRATAEDKEFRVGVVASVTGPFAAATKDTFDGLNAFLKLHGVPGRRIVLETLDDETNPVNASNLFRRLAADSSINLIYLFVNSNSAMAAKSFASEFKVPIISGGGADSLGKPADPWLFKIAPANRDYMIALSDYIKLKGYKRIAQLYSNDTFGQYDLNNLRALAPQYGYDLVDTEAFSIDDTNFNAQLARIRSANPDLVYSSATGRAGSLAFRQYKQLGLTIPLVSTGANVSAAFFSAIGGAEKADGLMAMTQRGALGEQAGGDTAKRVAELRQALDGRTPVFFNCFGWDVGEITAAALAKSDGTRQGIRDAMEGLTDLPTLNGKVTYTAQDHTGQDARSIVVGKLVKGTFVPAD